MASAINSDNGVVSGTAGLKSSADSSGVLDLQTNGTTAISISASQVVTYTNQPTYTGGTANGVMYLNGSKAVTTGSALTFDGTKQTIASSASASPVELLRLSNTGSGDLTQAQITFYAAGTNYAVITGGYNGAPSLISNVANTGYHSWQVATNEKMRLDSSGNLGLGVTPSAWAAGQGAMQFKAGGLSPWALGGVNGYLYSNAYYDGSANRYINNGTAATYAINNGNGAHLWFTAPSGTAGNSISFTQALTLNANGALALQGGDTTASGVGITFPATQVASSNANTLDDYEEGTWTPTLVATGSAFSGVSFSGGTARYVKIGKVVTFYIGGTFTFSVAGTGDFAIGGLPFTIVSSSPTPNGGAAPLVRYITWTGSYMSDHCRSSTTNIEFWGVTNGGSYTRVPCSGLVSTFEIYMSHFYEAAA